MMIRFIFTFVFCCGALFGSEGILKERLGAAKSGDYLVFESNQMVTLLHIHSVNANTLTLEEIAIPQKNLKERPLSWPEWVKAKAPGHSSWSMLEIDLKTGQIVECYSFSRTSWVQLTPSESLLATLLQLPLTPIETAKQRRIGPPPGPGESDFRKIWQPSLVYEGKTIEKAQFDAYETQWPKDGTELSGKTITLYFDKTIQFPLPFWVSIEASHATGVLHAIDSGRRLSSPFRLLPKRVPQFIGQPRKTEKGLSLSLKTPKYFRAFDLFAVDVTTRDKQIFPIAHTLVPGEGESLTLEIDAADLESLETGHRYTWLLVPIGHSEFYTETNKPFIPK